MRRQRKMSRPGAQIYSADLREILEAIDAAEADLSPKDFCLAMEELVTQIIRKVGDAREDQIIVRAREYDY